MKLLGSESLVVAILAAAVSPIKAEVLEDECIIPHQKLKDLGARQFSELLMARELNLKYGQFTIFAPSDKLLGDSVLILENAGHTKKTIDDIMLFHVSAAIITEDITDQAHCGKPLLMLNEELHINQENSTTNCEGGDVFQIGPGNVDKMPQVIGEPVHACDSVIYMIDDALMLPTLPSVTLPPTSAPTKPRPPTPILPTAAPTDDSGSSMLSSSKEFIAFTAFAGLIAFL